MISTEIFTKWLEQFINFERDPKKDLLNLEKMHFYAAQFGNPQNAYKTIHVAGSKGKGSVSTMISSCLTEAGFKTGLYTSPHVTDFRERVSLAGTFFSDEAYSKAYLEIMDGFEKIVAENPKTDPTWFEVVTCLSFVIFRNEAVDYAVFEVGLGGRLDTTNIINPRVCAIMPIELEHCQYLGDTLAKIAFEKAGIIKQGVPFFCFEQKDEALHVFQKTARDRNAPMFYMPDVIQTIDYTVSFNGLQMTVVYNGSTKPGSLFTRPLKPVLQLLDEVQAKNAALVAALVKYVEPSISEDVLERGLHNAWLLGRFEVLRKEPPVIVDGAHTITSLSLSVSTFEKLINGGEKGVLVLACAEDKDVEHFAPLFERDFDRIYLTIPGVFKKSNLERLQKAFETYYRGKPQQLTVSHDFQTVIKEAYAEATEKRKPLLIAGSFYLVGEAKKLI